MLQYKAKIKAKLTLKINAFEYKSKDLLFSTNQINEVERQSEMKGIFDYRLIPDLVYER